MKTVNPDQYRCTIGKCQKKFKRSSQFLEFISHTNKHIEIAKKGIKLEGKLIKSMKGLV